MLLSEQTYHFHMPQRNSEQKEQRQVYDKLPFDTEGDLRRSSYFVACTLEDGCDPRTPAPSTAGHAAAAGGRQG